VYSVCSVVSNRWATLVFLAWSASASAASITGSDWIVHFNLPDQNSSAIATEEYDIREALVRRIDALRSNDTAWLATYTFSGNTPSAGAAGSIMNAIHTALDRGASVRFAVDNVVDTNAVYGFTNSLATLAQRPVNPLVLVQSSASADIMHHKLGVFDYGGTGRWVFVMSWNFTGGASINQWNIGLELQSAGAFTAFTNEFAEFLAGRFNNSPSKSHAHDRSTFTLAAAWDTNVVRFAPYPEGHNGGNNAQTDLTNLIAQAEGQIVFTLNKLTRPYIATSLVQAANRGVVIHGAMPRSDTDPAGNSAAIYNYLTNTASYTTTNVVHFVPAYSRADYSTVDAGESDLIHAKYMVIDPFGERPVLIHGSANWTDAALVSAGGNDENVLVIRHSELARTFYGHFKRITGTFQDRSDFWLGAGTGSTVRMWTTDTNVYRIERATSLTGTWSTAQTVTGRVGFADYPIGAATSEFRRARR
jgi:phosphatidylserine/phosphatidylglycerophosphate/cardiolipin synthase-like enzyme